MFPVFLCKKLNNRILIITIKITHVDFIVNCIHHCLYGIGRKQPDSYRKLPFFPLCLMQICNINNNKNKRYGFNKSK